MNNYQRLIRNMTIEKFAKANITKTKPAMFTNKRFLYLSDLTNTVHTSHEACYRHNLEYLKKEVS